MNHCGAHTLVPPLQGAVGVSRRGLNRDITASTERYHVVNEATPRPTSWVTPLARGDKDAPVGERNLILHF